MASVRLNSEKKIESNDFKLKIGTTNKINPIVIYVEGHGFISPVEEKDDYSHDISEIKHSLKSIISTCLRKERQFDNKFIVDFQVASSGISVGKKSFLSFQFLFRQNAENVMKLTDVKKISEKMIGEIAGVLKNSITDCGFTLTKTKK